MTDLLSKDDLVEGGRKSHSGSYWVALTLCLALGCFNCGFALGGNTNVGEVLGVQLGWGDDAVSKNTAISTAAVAGLFAGAIFSKPITNLGRRRAILIMNVVIAAITIPYFFTESYGILLTTRLILGFASAVIVNASSLFLCEFVPEEL